ncbi:MAG: hypothetical protein ABUT20_62315 [Bacteroidota bacterium]
MRTIITAALLISVISADAQIPVSLNFAGPLQQNLFVNNNAENLLNKKWSLTSYNAVSAGLFFYNGTVSNFIAVPVGLQFNRQLNKNLYAFAGLAVAPVYINSNRFFLSQDVNKPYPGATFFNASSFGVYPMAELGLMYVNDDKTFSISGSISVQHGTYYYPQQQNVNNRNTIITTNR